MINANRDIREGLVNQIKKRKKQCYWRSATGLATYKTNSITGDSYDLTYCQWITSEQV